MRRALAVVGMVLLGLTACGSRPDTAADVRSAIAAYREKPDEARAAEVEARFARLDADIADRRAEAARADADDRPAEEAAVAALEKTRGELRSEYLSVRMQAVGNAAGDALKAVGRSIGEGLEEAGRKLREAAGGGPPATDQ
jgi:hypothetical protein